MHLPSKPKVLLVQKIILNWYKSNGRVFPWRKKTLSVYHKIITEVLLQRTKAETASKFYPVFFKKYSSWKNLSRASIKELQGFLKPIGLSNQRGKRLYDLAQVMRELNFRLPKTINEIERLPMMGQYLVNSVRLLIFEEPAPLIDVNMARVLERYFGKRKLSDIRYDPYLQKLAHAVVNHKSKREINWAILDFAALMCKSRAPLCELCSLKKGCLHYNQTEK